MVYVIQLIFICVKCEILRFVFLIALILVQITTTLAQPKQHLPYLPPLTLEFSQASGIYSTSQVVEIYAPTNTEVRFTTDGSVPDRNARKYQYPFTLDHSTVIRAVAYRGKEKGEELVGTFLIKEPPTSFPSIALAIDPALLFDPDYGLFVEGNNVKDSTWAKVGANFWSRQELEMFTEVFESDGRRVFGGKTGFRLFGGFSRLFPQKSITIVSREEYGDKRIEYPIFGKDRPKKFKHLVLRNSGSDFGKTHFRDAFMTSLTHTWDMEQQAARPTQVYINGKYWGIYNVREKVNRFFINAYHDVDKDSLDILEHEAVTKTGSKRHYLKMLRFVETHDLASDQNFDRLSKLMEINNFMDYKIAQIYFDNQDAGGNIKFWRPQTPDGRWRWILYDTDWGYGLHNHYAYRNNSLQFHTEPNGPSWPNPPWTTFLLRNLLKNKQFQQQFVNRFADHLNTVFDTLFVAQRLQTFEQLYLPEIDRHIDRWNLSKSKWKKQVNVLYTFGQKRPAYIRKHLMDYFDTGKAVELELATSAGGKIMLNDQVEVRHQFKGTYFENMPVEIEVVADLGFRFSHWEWSGINEEVKHFEWTLKAGNNRLKAVFKPYHHPLVDQIVINEVSPNNKKSKDWLELYNASDETVDLKNWKLTDRKNIFLFPEVKIAPKDYLVICEDSTKLLKVFPDTYNIIDGLGFGLNKFHEKIQLFAADDAMVDSVNYTLTPTDSVFTYNLILPHLDNADPENWNRKLGIGTPNAGNPYFIESTVKVEQAFWIQLGLTLSLLLFCLLLLYLKHAGHLDQIYFGR